MVGLSVGRKSMFGLSGGLGGLPLYEMVFGVSDTICNNSLNSLDSISEKINVLLPHRLCSDFLLERLSF